MGSAAGSSARVASPASSTAVSSVIAGAPITEGSSVGSAAGSSARATSPVSSTAVSSIACTSWLLPSSTGTDALLSGMTPTGSEAVRVGTTPVVSAGMASSEPRDPSSDTSSLWTSSTVFASADVNVVSSSDPSLLGQATVKVSQALLSGSSDFKDKQ